MHSFDDELGNLDNFVKGDRNTARLGIRLSAKLKEQVLTKAEQEHVDISLVIRKLLQQWIEQ